METTRTMTSTDDLEFDTLAMIDAFRELSDHAARLLARSDVLLREWATETADSRVCDWGQAPRRTSPMSVLELADWIRRAGPLTDVPGDALGVGCDAVTSLVGDHGPGYFLG